MYDLWVEGVLVIFVMDDAEQLGQDGPDQFEEGGADQLGHHDA